MDYKLEICVDNIESAIIAQNAGADRVELCNNLPEGGTTPGYGTIASVRNNLTIGIHVIIRPRGGDFVYSSREYDIMRRDIDVCGECNVDGIVLGILTPEGRVDVERTAKLIELAHPMTATYHRAFDLSNDPLKRLEEVIATKAGRLLTSGLKNKAVDGIELIRKLVEKAGNRIIIMPGSGINEKNIEKIASVTKAGEYHLTGRKVVESEMIFRREGVSMGLEGISEYSRKIADQEAIKNIISILKNLKSY